MNLLECAGNWNAVVFIAVDLLLIIKIEEVALAKIQPGHQNWLGWLHANTTKRSSQLTGPTSVCSLRQISKSNKKANFGSLSVGKANFKVE